MTQTQRITELLAIFAGREEMYDLGQVSPQDRRRLSWAVTRGIVKRERRGWPYPQMYLVIKTVYVLNALTADQSVAS